MPVIIRQNGGNADGGGSNQQHGYRSSFEEVLNRGGNVRVDEDGYVPGFRNSYSSISDEDRISRSTESARKDRAEEERNSEDNRRMNDWDRLFAAAGDLSEEVTSVSGFQGIDFGDPGTWIPGVVSLGVNTALSTATSPLSAASNLYGGIFGRNVWDADTESGMLGEQPSSNQRWGAIATGAIDLAGLGFGGSREAIEGIAHAVTGNAAKAAESVARYGAGEVVKDIASEGIEEGIQSITEDIRDGRDVDLGRAAESALYGGIGGGMMSGLGYGINRLTAGDRETSEPSPVKQEGRRFWSYDGSSPQTSIADTEMMSHLEDELAKNNESQMSASYTGVTGSPRIRITEVDLGIRSLRRMYQRDEDQKNWLAKSTEGSANPLTVERLDEIFSMDDDAAVAALNQEIENGTVFKAAVKRDPKTKLSSLAAFDIRRVYNGDSIMFNPAIPSFFGGDLDGDTWRIHFDDEAVRGTKYMTAYFMSPRPLPDDDGNASRYGTANWDFDFSSMQLTQGRDDVDVSEGDPGTYVRRQRGKKVVRRKMNPHVFAAFDAIQNDPKYLGVSFHVTPEKQAMLDELRSSGDKDAAKKAKRALRYASPVDALKRAIREIDSGVDPNLAYAKMFQDLRDEVAIIAGSTNEDGVFRKNYELADQYVADLFQLYQIHTWMDRDIVRIQDRYYESVDKTIAPLEEAVVKYADTAGTLGSKRRSVLQLLQFIGRSYQMFTQKENPVLRTDQAMQWASQTARDVMSEIGANPSAVDALIAWQMGIIEVGTVPYDSLITTFNSMVLSKMFMDGSLSTDGTGVVGDGGMTFEQFRDSFIEAYNEYQKPFNDALEKAGWGDDKFVKPDGYPKDELSKDDMKSFWKAFNQILGGANPRSIFMDVQETMPMTMSGLFEDMVSGGKSEYVNTIMSSNEQAMFALMDGAKHYNDLDNQRGVGIENTVESAVKMAKQLGLSVEFVDGKANVPLEQMPVLHQYVNMVRELIGYKAAAYFGLMNDTDTLASMWAPYLFSHDPNVVKFTIGCMHMAYKYRYYIESEYRADRLQRRLDSNESLKGREAPVKAKIASRIKQYRDNARESALENAGLSTLDRIVCEQIALTGRSDLLEMLTNPTSISYEDLKQKWADYWETENSSDVMPENIMSAMLKSSESEIGSGELSMRKTQATRAIRNMEANSVKRARETWASIEEQAKSSKDRGAEIAKAITKIGKACLEYQNVDILAAAIADTMFVMHDTSAKGTSPDSSGANYMQLAMHFDSVGDVLNSMTSRVSGSVPINEAVASRSMIINALFNNESYEIIDPENGGHFTLDRASILREAGIEVAGDEDLSFGQYSALFQKFPQLITMIPPTTFQPIPRQPGQVKQVSTRNLQDAVNDWISDADFQTNMNVRAEYAQIEARLSNNSKFVQLVLGDVAARAEKMYDDGFDGLMERPDRLTKEIKDSYGRWSKIIHRLIRATSDELSRSKTKFQYRNEAAMADEKRTKDALQSLQDLFDSQMQRAQSISRVMASEVGYENVVSNAISFVRKTLSYDETEAPAKRGIDRESRNEQFKNAVRDTNSVLAIVTEGASKPITTFEELMADQRVIQQKNDYINANKSDPDAGTKFDDALREYVDATNVDKKSAEKMSKIAIMSGDMIDAESFRKKIRYIVESGEYGTFDDTDIPSIKDIQDLIDNLKDPKKAGSARRQLMRLRNRWNSVILSATINKQSRMFHKEMVPAYPYYTWNALNTLDDVVDELREEMGDDLTALPEDGDIRIPDLDFTSTTVTAFADHAQSISESSGNMANSGIEGGVYKNYLSLGALSETTCNHINDSSDIHTTTPVRMTKTQLLNALKSHSGDFVNPYEHCRAVLEGDNGRVLYNVTEYSIRNLPNNKDGSEPVFSVYPLNESPHGIGTNTMTGVNKDKSGYVGIRHLLMDFVYINSEKSVFNRKKSLSIFDSVVRRIAADPAIKGRRFDIDMSDPNTIVQLREQMVSFRTDLAKSYYENIKAEKLDGDFGKYDMLMLAQFTTPFIEARSADGKLSVNIPIEVLFSEPARFKFDTEFEQINGFPFTELVSFKPRVLPVSAIFAKMDRELASAVSEGERSSISKRYIADRKALNALVEESLYDWSDYKEIKGGVSMLLNRVAPLTMSSRTVMPQAGDAIGTLKFLKLMDMMPGYKEKRTRRAEEDAVSLMGEERYKARKAFTDSWFGVLPQEAPLLVSYGKVDEMPDTPTGQEAAFIKALKALGTPSGSTEVPFDSMRIAEAYITDDPRRVADEYMRCRAKGVTLLYPSHMAGDVQNELMKRGVSEDVFFRNWVKTKPVSVDEFGNLQSISFAILDPYSDMKLDDTYVGPTTYSRIDDRGVIQVSVASYTNPVGADASSLYNRNKAARKSKIEGAIRFSMDDLFGSHMGKRVVIDRDNLSENLVEFKEEFQKWVDEDPTSRFVVPSFKPGAEMSREEIIASVRGYISSAAQANEDGLLQNEVGPQQTIWFSKLHTMAGDYYAPMIVNTGGVPLTMDSVNASILNELDGDEITLLYEGSVAPTEYDAMKQVFDVVAWKAMETVATEEEMKDWAVPMIPGLEDGADRMYNARTERSRTVEQKEAILRGNCFWLSRLIDCSAFFHIEGGRWVEGNDSLLLDLSKANDLQFYNHLVKPAITNEWIQVANGYRIFKDSRMNDLAQVVARAAIDNGIPPIYMFGSIVKDYGGRIGSAPLFCNPAYIFTGFVQNDYLKFFSTIDSRICPDSASADIDGHFLDHYGRIRCKAPDGDGDIYRDGHIEPAMYKLISTQLGNPSYRGAFSDQQLINRAATEGFHYTDMDRVTDMYLIKAGNYNRWTQGMSYDDLIAPSKKSRRGAPLGFDPSRPYGTESTGRVSLLAFRLKKIESEGDNFYRMLDVVESDDNRVVMDKNDPKVKSQLGRLKNALGMDKATTRQLMCLIKAATGSTYNDGDGSHEITYSSLNLAVNEIIKNINAGRYPISGGMVNGRISIPMMPKPMQDWLWSSPKVQSLFSGDRSEFDAAAIEEFDKTRESLATVKPKSKMISLSNLMAYVAKSNDRPWPLENHLGYLDPYYIAHTFNPFMDRFMDASGADMADRWDRNGVKTRQMLEDFNELQEARRYAKLETESAPSGFIALWRGSKKSGFARVADTMISLSRANAVMSPMLPGSAFVQRQVGSGMTKFEMFLDDKVIQIINGMGGNIKTSRLNRFMFEENSEGANRQAVLHEIAKNNQNLRRIWSALNELQLSGSDIVAIRSANDTDDVIRILENVRRRDGRLGFVAGKIFRMSTLSGVGTTGQIENFFNYVISRMDPDEFPWYFEVNESGKTNLELALESSPENLLIDLVTGRNDNPALEIGLAGRNFALEGEHSQQTAASLILNEALARHSVLSFLLTTNVMRFPTYVLNVQGWYLKHVLPVSSFNYWATQKLIESGNNNGFLAQIIGKVTGVDISKLHLERTQTFASMQEALVNDVVRLGYTNLAMIIASLAFEPPEDEDKWGNLNEWTIFGIRLDDVWWLQDIAGPSFAIAAAWKSAMLGHPRLDIVPNWLGSAMSSNPLVKVGDVVGMLFNEENPFLDGMVSEDQLYGDGTPTTGEVFASGVATWGLNFMSQFLMPSFIREAYTTGNEMEHSYKLVYARDQWGNIIYNDDGSPRTVRASYYDTQIRRLTRNNPFAALVMNVIGDSGTGYFRNEMPLTVYYETAQLECMEYYSLYETDPETGQEVPRPVEERRAIAYEILSELASRTPEELAESGFMIDYETRAYVSKTLWDLKAYLQDEYNTWIQDTGRDAYLIGEGDFTLGMQRISNIEEAYWADYNYIDDLYERLWDESIASGPQKYNRYQTTYQQDQWGNWYATGFRRTMFSLSPFDVAPGTLSDPGSTMGHDYDWDTESVVMPGRSTGERALIPVESVYTDVPEIETWASDGNGGGYSDIWADSLGDAVDGTLDDSEDGESSYPWSGRPGYSRRRGGRGGGGGGGYSPNIYSRLPNVYTPTPKAMYWERVYDADSLYFRPGFEVKGSREAYKRSDI